MILQIKVIIETRRTYICYLNIHYKRANDNILLELIQPKKVPHMFHILCPYTVIL